MKTSLFDPAPITVEGPLCLLALGWWNLNESKYHSRAINPQRAHEAMVEQYKAYVVASVNFGGVVASEGVRSDYGYMPNPEYRLIGVKL